MQSSGTVALSQQHVGSLHAAGATTSTRRRGVWAGYHSHTAVPQTQALYVPVSASAPTSWSLAGSCLISTIKEELWAWRGREYPLCHLSEGAMQPWLLARVCRCLLTYSDAGDFCPAMHPLVL